MPKRKGGDAKIWALLAWSISYTFRGSILKGPSIFSICEVQNRLTIKRVPLYLVVHWPGLDHLSEILRAHKLIFNVQMALQTKFQATRAQRPGPSPDSGQMQGPWSLTLVPKCRKLSIVQVYNQDAMEDQTQ